jgi:hypothetical protein
MFEMDACTQNLETQEKKYFMFSYCIMQISVTQANNDFPCEYVSFW